MRGLLAYLRPLRSNRQRHASRSKMESVSLLSLTLSRDSTTGVVRDCENKP